MKKSIKIFNSLFLIISILALFSCKRNEGNGNDPMELTIKGIVKETQTGKLLSDIKIRVYRIKSTNGGFGSYEEIIGEERTNADGFYEMKLDVKRNEFIYIVAAEAGKLGYFGPTEYRLSVNEPVFQYNIDLVISGHLNFYLENKDAYYDSIIIDCNVEDEFSFPSFHRFKGKAPSYIGNKTFVTPAGKDIKFKCTVNKKGVIEEYIHYIDVPYWDTAFFKGSF
jgi:hypothetical protein